MAKSITFRVTDTEHEEIFEDAAACGKTATDLIKLSYFNIREYILHLENRNSAVENELRRFKENYLQTNG
ncbi:plasmid mobilization protein [Deefgea rivuli]|uniref:plasmid mobilization protein n=1 Tax=Deefgea rivuli TaxID=400948 RepID=UPI000481845C|nr:hypothetical protein [Deefgea rivuli]